MCLSISRVKNPLAGARRSNAAWEEARIRKCRRTLWHHFRPSDVGRETLLPTDLSGLERYYLSNPDIVDGSASHGRESSEDHQDHDGATPPA